MIRAMMDLSGLYHWSRKSQDWLNQTVKGRYR